MNALLASALLALAAPQAPPVFRAEVGLVRIEVLVTRKGVPFHGLTAADFEVRDDGRVQDLEQALEEETPVDAALVLDMSGSVRGAKLDALREAARAFLDGLHEGEQAALVAFREEVLLLEPFTADRARVKRALERAEPRGSTALCDAVYAALRLRDPGPRRSAVVVFSDGIDNLSWLGPLGRRRGRVALRGHRLRRDHAREGRLEGAVPGRRRPRHRRPALRGLERARPARAVPRRPRRHPRPLRAELRAERTGSPGWHALDVRLKRVKGDVLARPGYWRGTAAP